MSFVSWWLTREIDYGYQEIANQFRAFGKNLTVLLHRTELGLS